MISRSVFQDGRFDVLKEGFGSFGGEVAQDKGPGFHHLDGSHAQLIELKGREEGSAEENTK